MVVTSLSLSLSLSWEQKSAGEVEGDDSRLDMRVEQVWLQGFTGRGVTTTVIDDGKCTSGPS